MSAEKVAHPSCLAIAFCENADAAWAWWAGEVTEVTSSRSCPFSSSISSSGSSGGGYSAVVRDEGTVTVMAATKKKKKKKTARINRTVPLIPSRLPFVAARLSPCPHTFREPLRHEEAHPSRIFSTSNLSEHSRKENSNAHPLQRIVRVRCHPPPPPRFPPPANFAETGSGGPPPTTRIVAPLSVLSCSSLCCRCRFFLSSLVAALPFLRCGTSANEEGTQPFFLFLFLSSYFLLVLSFFSAEGFVQHSLPPRHVRSSRGRAPRSVPCFRRTGHCVEAFHQLV